MRRRLRTGEYSLPVCPRAYSEDRNTNTPEPGVRGRFGTPRGACQRTAVRPLRGVFGRHPLVPMVFSGLFVRRPEVGPEADRFRRRGATLYHDSERPGGRDERETCHG
jgi:hypothetical protein